MDKKLEFWQNFGNIYFTDITNYMTAFQILRL